MVFRTSDLRGRNSWYSGFPGVYQLRAALSSGWEYHTALGPCKPSEGLEMSFLHLPENLNKWLMLNSATIFTKSQSSELFMLH